jgi:Uma2 family endonuclease
MESTQTLLKPTATQPEPVQESKISLPDHKQLPDSDGTFVKNFQEHPQSIVLTSSITPVLEKLHPDGRYCIGQDSGIYWRLMEPPERGAEAPDWFYVPNVSPLLDGEYRRSYVLWKEFVAPLIAIEFVSGNGSDERDVTPPSETEKAGKFWVYEQAIRIPFYAIFDGWKDTLEVYQLLNGRYAEMQPNDRGHYPISPMGVEIGLQQVGATTWLRWWEESGDLLLTGDERAVQADERAVQADERAVQANERAVQAEAIADQERLIATQERLAKQDSEQKAQRLAEKLRSLGLNPDDV